MMYVYLLPFPLHLIITWTKQLPVSWLVQENRRAVVQSVQPSTAQTMLTYPTYHYN